jgi:hypothetical protein
MQGVTNQSGLVCFDRFSSPFITLHPRETPLTLVFQSHPRVHGKEVMQGVTNQSGLVCFDRFLSPFITFYHRETPLTLVN